MWITKRELNRRIEMALAEQDRERYRQERFCELERRMERQNEELFKRLCELERRIVETDSTHGDEGKCVCMRVNT